MAEPGSLRSHVSAVQLSARLLCWSLAAGLAFAAVDLALDPHVPEWSVMWTLPWWLACGSALTWAVLRAREKAARHPPYDEAGGGVPGDWEQAA